MKIEKQIGTLLTTQHLTLATAESCTGGLVAHRITNVSGSSAYYVGGFVTYANEAKEALLGVRRETLLAHGAVSQETAQEMAQGSRQRLGADLAVSVTGIAGPSGGTTEKPVGLVYIALAAPDVELCQRHVWQGGRLSNKEQSAEAALRMLLAYLQEQAPSRRVGGKMVEFVNEPLIVQTELRKNEMIRPVAFLWRGKRFQIEAWGRESTQELESQAVHCYLVQTAGAETWELCHDREKAQWTLARHWANKLKTA